MPVKLFDKFFLKRSSSKVALPESPAKSHKNLSVSGEAKKRLGFLGKGTTLQQTKSKEHLSGGVGLKPRADGVGRKP